MRNMAIDIKVLNNLIHREMEQRSRLMAGDMVSGVNGMIMGYMLSKGGNVFQSAQSTVARRIEGMEPGRVELRL